MDQELAAMSESSNASSDPSYRYKDMYTRWMERIEIQDEYDKNLAKQALAMVVCSKRGLTPEELRYALAIHDGDTKLDERGLCDLDDVMSSCDGLIYIDRETDTVRLVHGSTAAEFFNAHLSEYFPEPELYVARICMTILNFPSYTKVADSWRTYATLHDRPTLEEDVVQKEKIHQQFERLPFLRYAAFYWPQHLRICGQKLLDPALLFLESGSRFKFLFYQIWYHFDKYIPHPENRAIWLDAGEHLLLVSARLGLTCVYETILDRDPEERLSNINRGDDGRRTALFFATRMNHAEMVRFLVNQQGLDITLGPRMNDGLTPLAVACQEGNPEVLAELLKHPALTVNTCVNCRSSSTPWLNAKANLPIHSATQHGHLRLVQHLVETEEYEQDADVENGDHMSPLQIACAEGHEDVVSYLLEISTVNINRGTTGESTPLGIAIRRQYVEITRMLLQRPDIDLQLELEHGRTALHYMVVMSISQGVDMAKLLLQRQVFDIEARDDDGNTPLLVAAPKLWLAEEEEKEKDENLADLLVCQGGANIHAINNSGQTLLHMATKNGRVESMKHLIETYQLDIATEDSNGLTPVDYALVNLEFTLFNFLFDMHLKGSCLRIEGQCEHVSDKGHGEYIMRRYRCSLALTNVHSDCGQCMRISERLRSRSFYLDEDDALVMEAREQRPMNWCIRPMSEDLEELEELEELENSEEPKELDESKELEELEELDQLDDSEEPKELDEPREVEELEELEDLEEYKDLEELEGLEELDALEELEELEELRVLKRFEKLEELVITKELEDLDDSVIENRVPQMIPS